MEGQEPVAEWIDAAVKKVGRKQTSIDQVEKVECGVFRVDRCFSDKPT